MSDEPQNMKPSNYLDNDSNSKWEWHIDNEKVEIVTRHDHPKEHEHHADVTKVPIGEMVDNPDPIIGQAHRNSAHYYKDGKIRPSENTNIEKDAKNMSYGKEHQAFVESLNPANYRGETGLTNTGAKKTSSEDDGKGQRALDHPKGKNDKAVKQMRSDMKNDSKIKDAKDAKANVTKAQNVSPKGAEGKSGTNTVSKSTNGNGSKGGNTTGGKGNTGIGKGGASTGGKGGSPGGHGTPGGNSGGHGGGLGSSGGGHGGGYGGR